MNRKPILHYPHGVSSMVHVNSINVAMVHSENVREFDTKDDKLIKITDFPENKGYKT